MQPVSSKNGNPEERTSSEKSLPTGTEDLRCNESGDTHTYNLRLTADQWSSMTSPKQRMSCNLASGWTNILYNVYAEAVENPCILVFKRGYLKARSSRQMSGCLFSASASCKFASCGKKFNITFKDELTSKDVLLEVRETGQSGHVDGSRGRHLTGSERKSLAREVLASGPYSCHTQLINADREGALKHDNISSVPSSDV